MRYLPFFAFCLSFSACSFFCDAPPPPEKPVLNLPNAPVLKLDKVRVTVLTKENVRPYFENVRKTNNHPVVIGLTTTDYKNLSLNLEKIKAHIKNQQKIIDAYRRYYEDKNGK